jgi:PAB-dependent poly(A)-specific ribonuclease subunit 3
MLVFSFLGSASEESYGYEEGKETTQQVAEGVYQEASILSGPSAPPPFRSLHSMGMEDELWRYHREIAIEAVRQMDPTDPRHKAVPIPYCNAYCMDAPSQTGTTRSSFGYPSSTFQVTSREDGHLYCLRRFDNVKSVSPKIAAAVLEKWSKIDHPGLVPLDQRRGCFVAQRAVFFVHRYIPGARSLRDRWTGPLSESVLWSSIAQFVSVLRRVHSANLAVRCMDLAHVLSKTDASQMRLRVYLNCAGIVDALEFESRKNLGDLQNEDIRDLGRLILSMATGTEITSKTDNNTLNRCEQFCAQNYSRELHNLCFTLIRSPVAPTIVDVSRAMAGRALDELDAVHASLDRTETALAAEYESGRALRLLLKLGFVNERPEFGPNRRWAQTGDCYVLTLFRDYGEYS